MIKDFSFDYEREHLKESVFLQADFQEEYLKLQQEINEKERLPAKITVIDLKEIVHEPESNPLAL